MFIYYNSVKFHEISADSSFTNASWKLYGISISLLNPLKTRLHWENTSCLTYSWQLLPPLQAIYHYIPKIRYFSKPKTAVKILHLSCDPPPSPSPPLPRISPSLAGKTVLTQFSTRTFWNRSLATSNLFHMSTQSIDFYTFYCYILYDKDVWKMWFIK